MAKTVNIHPAELDRLAGAPETTTIKFKLPGLTQDYNEDGVFNLTAQFAPLNLSRVFEDLVAQGISERLADDATAMLGEFVFARQLGEHFAKNMERR